MEQMSCHTVVKKSNKSPDIISEVLMDLLKQK